MDEKNNNKKTSSTKEQNKKELRQRIILAVAVLLLIVALIGIFLATNYQRTLVQNGMYLEASTEQTLDRLNDTFSDSQQSIHMAAKLLEADRPTEDKLCDELAAMLPDTPFSFISFESADGTIYNSRGVKRETNKPHQVTEANAVTVNDERIGEGTSIVFYEPVYDGDTYLGVLSGVWNNEMLEETIEASFFSQLTSTYLCTNDGTIIVRSSKYVTNDTNVLDIYVDDNNEVSANKTVGELQQSMELGEATTFTYDSPRGTGTAYLVNLADHDWILLRTYPAGITSSIVQDINTIGVVAILAVVVIFGVGVAIMMIRNGRKNASITEEKERFKRVVEASSALFKRYAIIDLENDAYEYVKAEDIDGRLPMRGKFSDFAAFWSGQAIDDDEHNMVSDILDPPRIHLNFANGVEQKRFEYRVRHNGEVRWLQISIICLRREEDGKPASLLYAVQDVTDIKAEEARSREALEEAYRVAEQASHAKSDFLGSMSHDIRTPMNSIMGLTAIATMHMDDPERVKDCLSKITISSRHLLGLINEVLDMAKIESGNIGLAEDDFDLPEAVENLLTIIHPQISAKQQHLKVDIAGVKHEHVVGDFMRLQQVFVNIMGNAVKFTPEGGTIGLTIAERPSRIHGCGCYEFAFSDTGCGMSEDFVERVFEPFSRAHDTRVSNVEGTGLGMAIVKSVVSLMNGSIDVKSKVGEGTTFTVTIHLKLREADLEDTTALCDLRVLVADNDETACENACDMLSDIGMSPDYVLSGDAAIQRVRETFNTVDEYVAVILDWKMPGKSGIETARELRDILPEHVPIIILSAYDWMAIEQEARMAGIDAFVSKPLFKSRLVHVMNELLVHGRHAVPSERKEDKMDNNVELLREADFSDRRILLVEDNELAASIGLDILSFTGAQSERAANGKIALEMLRDNEPGYFDLILMDGQMPVMNGYEATQAIRSLGLSGRPDLASIPIVALTADAFADDVKRALSVGMNAHITKPLEIETLMKILGQFLG